MRARIPLILVGLALLAALPLVATSYYLYLVELAMINVIIAVGLNLLSGNCGQISLCNASFMAVGAYCTAIFTTRFGLPTLISLPLSVIMAALLGAALGYPARRLSGLYLALVTLGFLELVGIVLEEFPAYTGGIRGLKVPWPEMFGFSFQSNVSLYLLVFALTVGAIAVAYNIQQSRYGRAFDAVRQSPFAAQALGIPVARVKLIAFSLNAAFAGFGGGLLAGVVGFIDPPEFGILTSIQHITFIVVGGLGSIAGSIAGAVVLTALPEALRGVQEYGELVYGFILLATLLFLPRGLVGLVARLEMLRPAKSPVNEPPLKPPAKEPVYGAS
jgi:branched-chain amino acid transport system permease protein